MGTPGVEGRVLGGGSLGGRSRVEGSLVGGEGGEGVPVRRPKILRFCFFSSSCAFSCAVHDLSAK